MLGRQATLSDLEIAQFVHIDGIQQSFPFQTSLYLVPRGPPIEGGLEYKEAFNDVAYGKVMLSGDRKKAYLDWSSGYIIEGEIPGDISNEVNTLSELVEDYVKDFWSVQRINQPALSPKNRTFAEYQPYGAHLEFVFNSVAWPTSLSQVLQKLCGYGLFNDERIYLTVYNQGLESTLAELAKLYPGLVREIREKIVLPARFELAPAD